jgi:hypothetical protein
MTPHLRVKRVHKIFATNRESTCWAGETAWVPWTRHDGIVGITSVSARGRRRDRPGGGCERRVRVGQSNLPRPKFRCGGGHRRLVFVDADSHPSAGVFADMAKKSNPATASPGARPSVGIKNFHHGTTDTPRESRLPLAANALRRVHFHRNGLRFPPLERMESTMGLPHSRSEEARVGLHPLKRVLGE